MKKSNTLLSALLTLALTACGSDGEGCYVVKKDDDHGIVICPADGSSYVIYSPENLPKANGLPNGQGGYIFCNAGYFGAECEACSCEHGTCNDGLNGNGECSCAKGYTGSDCSVLALGYMVDTTGKAYKTTVINGKEWMAENMATDSATDGNSVTCYANTDADPDFVEHYGCLYTWEEAQKVCPKGWHLPSQAEFETLINFASNDAATSSKNLRAESFADGKDLYGFAALPAGSYANQHTGFGTYANFWSGADLNNNSAYLMFIFPNGINLTNINKTYYHSVRCLKD